VAKKKYPQIQLLYFPVFESASGLSKDIILNYDGAFPAKGSILENFGSLPANVSCEWIIPLNGTLASNEGSMMKMRTWFLSGTGVVCTGIVLTMIVLWESMFPPWAPYFIFYAVLAILIPLTFKTYAFGSFREVLSSHWKLILGVFVLALIVDQGLATALYQRILDGCGVGGNPYYSLGAAMEELAGSAARKFGITRDTAMMIYALFIVVWAPVGEELFYRGYIQGALRAFRGSQTSALVSAAFFGIRHATHLFFLWPNVPLVATAAWVVGAFVFGLFMSFLYEKTRSLYPLMLVHAGVNLVELAFSL
jgi:membrane protease YdiL (CAAX protease family)